MLGVNKVLTLPSCFWSIVSGVHQIIISSNVPGYINIIGNNSTGSEHDPLLALSTDLTLLRLQGVALVNPITRNGLSSNGFSAQISQFLQQRPALIALEIHNSRLRGSLPSDMSSCTALERVYLLHNRLSGSLPRILPPNIETFDVTNNSFTGSLPSTLPASILRASFSYNYLSGSIPSTIFNAIEAEGVTFEFDHNSLSGPIPSTLFTNLKPSVNFDVELDLSYNQLSALPADLISSSSSIRTVSYLALNLANNQIGGTFPSSFFNGSFALTSVAVDLDSNRLSGTIPPTLFSGLSASGLRHLEFHIGSNDLSGSIPIFFDHMAQMDSLPDMDFNFTANRLAGTLPSKLVPPPSSSVLAMRWRLGSNSLSGTIPASLLSIESDLFETFVDLSHNALTGSIPPNLFENNDSSIRTSVGLNLAYNKLSGPLVASGLMAGIDALALDFSSNNLGGTIPGDYLTAFNAGRSRSRFVSISLSMNDCGLIGTVPDIPRGSLVRLDNNQLSSFSLAYTLTDPETSYSTIISIQNNRLAGTLTIPASDSNFAISLYLSKNRLSELVVNTPSDYLRQLAIGENSNLVGTLPSQFFTNSSRVELFIANHTKLSGNFPVVPYTLDTPLQTLDLSYSRVNFCVQNIQAWNSSSLINCNLKNTNAIQCARYYPAQCFVSPSAPTNGSPIKSQPMMLLALIVAGALALVL